MARYCAFNATSFNTAGSLSFPLWTGGSTTTSWEVEVDFSVTSLASQITLVGNTGAVSGAFDIFTNGAIGLRAWVASAAGLVVVGNRYTAKVTREGTNTLRVYLKLASESTYGAAVATYSTANTIPYNALGRNQNTPVATAANFYGAKFTGGTYDETWNGLNAPSTGTTWTGANGNQITLQGTQGTADAWWIYYNSISANIPNNTLGAALNQACAINLNNYFTGATSYSVLSGSLPTGLSIVGNQIVGTPTTAQSTTLVIRASNSIDTLDSATITFNTGLWYLNNATGGNSVVTIPSVTVGNNIGDYIEIKAVANAGNESGLYRIVGINSGYSALIGVEPTKLSVSIGSSNTAITAGYTQPIVGVPFTVKLRKSGVNQYTASMDGVDFAPFTAYSTFTVNQLFRWATESTGAFKGGIYYVSISTNGGTSATRYYDPNTNGGVGNLLIDRVSNQNGTQAGTWPADNSEWVSYSAGATYQLTAQGGTFTYSGQNAALNRGFKLAAQGGAYSYTGASANLSYTTATIYRLDALGASYSYAGASASLLRGFKLAANGGAYSYAGSDAVLRRGFKLAANGGAYNYAGADASLVYVAGPTVYRLTALGVTYVYSGADATLTATGVLPAANPAAFVNRAYVGGTLTNNAQVGGRLINNAKIGGSLTNNATVAI